jgi:RimJ/RimL family protein N-acetyltransferase
VCPTSRTLRRTRIEVAQDTFAGGRPSAVWRSALPTISTRGAVLREVEERDAHSLTDVLANPAVRRYLPVGPTTGAEITQFIRWVRRARRRGRYICFGVVPHAHGSAAGLFQLWPIEPDFRTAEMGFALDESLWGTGIFVDCAGAVIDFAIETLHIHRIEFRSAVENTRGRAALLKLGAVQEGTLRKCFSCPAGVLDHTMWSILADDWRQWRTGRRCA